MTSITLNTLLFDSSRRGGSDQAVLLPTGSAPVIVVFGESISMGAESTKASAQAQPDSRVYDQPYVGRPVGETWNNWLTTADGTNFEADGSNGTIAGSVGTAFERSTALGFATTGGNSTAYTSMNFVDPVWGLLREIYGLFRDEVTNEIILPRVVHVGRSLSYINPGDPGNAFSSGLSWQKSHEGETFSIYKSGWDCMTDVLDAVKTALTGTESYLVGLFTTIGNSDTLTDMNDGSTSDTWNNAAQAVGANIQQFREDLEAEYGIDQFPVIATLPRLVEGSNTIETVGEASVSLQNWADAYDMTALAFLKTVNYTPGGWAADDTTNPHTDGYGAIRLGYLWGTEFRNLLSSTTQVITAPPIHLMTDPIEIPSQYVTDGKILGQFEDVNQLLDAVASQSPSTAPEAEVDLTAPQITNDAPAPAEAASADLTIPNPEKVTGALDLADAGELYREAKANGGSLTPDTLAALGEKGIGEDMVNLALQGVEAQMVNEANEIANAVGGKESIDKAFAWAQSTMNPSEIDEINSALDAGSQTARTSIIRDLINRSGVTAKAVSGTMAGPAGVVGFESRQDFLNAMKAPEYKSSPSYRASVEARLAQSTWR